MNGGGSPWSGQGLAPGSVVFGNPTKHIPASVPTQALAVATVAVTIAAVAWRSGDWGALAVPLLGLLAGVGVSLALPPLPVFRDVPGWVAGGAITAFSTMLWAFGVRGVSPPWSALIALGLVVTGLDWHFADRAKVLVTVSGLILLFPVSADLALASPFAAGWVLLALATLWAVERDVRAATSRPATDRVRDRPPLLRDAGDLARMAGVALCAGALAAMLLGSPACQRTSRESERSGTQTVPERGAGAQDQGAGRGGQGSGGAGGGAGAGGGLGSGSGSGAGGGSGSGGAAGGRSGGGAGSGGADPSGRGDPLGQGDPSGRGDPLGQGDPSGRGDPLGQGDPSGGGDPLGQGDPSGGGRSGGASGLPPGVDPSGPASPGGNGAGRSGGGGSGASSNSSSSSSVDPSLLGPILAALAGAGLLILLAALLVPWLRRLRRRSRRDGEGDDGAAPPPWVMDLRRRLEREGAARGAPRRPAETVAAYAARLSSSVLPDPRLPGVGTVLTAALFGPVPVDPGLAAWAGSVVDAAVSAADGAGSRGGPEHEAAVVSAQAE